MTSKTSIIKLLVAAAALTSAIGAGNAASYAEQARPAQTSGANNGSTGSAGAVMPTSMVAVGAGSMVSATNAVAFGEAAADHEEAIPATNMAVMLLAAIGAMGLVVVRRSGSR